MRCLRPVCDHSNPIRPPQFLSSPVLSCLSCGSLHNFKSSSTLSSAALKILIRWRGTQDPAYFSIRHLEGTWNRFFEGAVSCKTTRQRDRESKRGCMEMEKERVCVTGAGGFVASWVVKLLLSKGYIVHGTIRYPGDEKYAHLNKLERAIDNLKLFKADLLDYNSLLSAIEGCAGVFHVACPVPTSTPVNPEVELLEPAVKGTLNVLRACSEAKVKRVVYVSSIAALMLNPKWPKDRVNDETCWSDKEYCRATENWYLLAKTEAETAALEYGKQNGLDVVSVNPGYVFGPLLQPTLNFSTLVLVNFVKGIFVSVERGTDADKIGDGDSVPNKYSNLVDVRDTADAILLAYEKPEAEGRYICVAHNIRIKDLAQKLRSLYPNLSYLENFTESRHDFCGSSEKLQKLGWTYRPLEETLVDSIESYREAALLVD